jgi:hypothetical protein
MRQGPDRDVSSILDGPNSAPYSLPAVGNLTQRISVEKKKSLIRKVLYPKLYDKLTKLGFKYDSRNSEEDVWTVLEASAVPESRTSTITTVVRQMWKGQEYLVWYSIERGHDSSGQELGGAFLSHGIDKDVSVKEIKNSEGVTTNLQLGNTYTDVYTIPFTKEKLEEILNKNQLDDKIQFSFCNNNNSFGGFSIQEMVHCSAKELSTRGTLGKAGDDLSVMYSELTAKDKLFLQSQAPK